MFKELSNSTLASSPNPIGKGDFVTVLWATLGKVKRNILPKPGEPQASNQPECNLASSNAIAKPSPVPPVFLFRAGSARQNLLNTRDDSPGFNPGPLSFTTTAIAS